MAELGKAYIEVRADLAKFPADLRAKLIGSLKTALAGVEFKELGEKAERAGEDAGEKAGKGFEKKAKPALERAAEKAGKGVLGKLISFFDSRRSNDSGSLFGSISGAISGGIADGLKQGQQIGDGLSKAGTFLSSVGGQVGSVLQIGAFAVLIPVVIQLAGALVQLGAALFALPAIAGVAVGALAPLIIAFQGFGEAVSAGLSGDVEKFNEALKGLPPSMRKVVKEVVGLKGLFTGVRTGIQEAFFKPLVGAVGPALRSLIGTVQPGLIRIASSLGNIGAALLRTFSSPENLRTFSELLATTNRVVQTMEPTVTNLAQALLNLIRPALPFIERGATAFRDFAANVEKFTRGIGQSGQLQSWLDKAADALHGILDVGKEVGKFFLTLFGGQVGDAGRDFLHSLAEGVAELNAFLATDDGQEAIGNLTTILKAAGAVFIFFVRQEKGALLGLNAFFDGVRGLLKGLEALGAGFVWVIQKIGEFAVWLGTGIGHGLAVAYRAVVDWVKSAGGAIGGFFTEDIPRWFGQAVDWFKALPGRILGAIEGFREAGRRFLIDALTGWYDAVFTQIGRIIGLFLALPYLVQAGWAKSINFLGNFFTGAWELAKAAWNAGVDAVVAFALSIPDRLSAAGDAIGGFFSDLGHSIAAFFTETLPSVLETSIRSVGDFMSSLWHEAIDNVRSTVENGYNAVVDFLYGLPGRVSGLKDRMFQAARSLGESIGRGLQEIGNFASDIGKRIVGYIKSGVNYVIDRINSGIGEIDNSLPISLPRLPKLAKGAIIDRPTMAIVGEAGPEAVIPLNNPARARELAQQSGLFDLLKMGRASSAVSVVVYLDPSGVIIPAARVVVNGELDQQGAELSYGTRDA